MRIVGGHFLGQAGTFVYLTSAAQAAPQFDAHFWPQLSLYNLLVANFWPLYWLGHILDGAKIEEAYWHIFDIARDRATDVFAFFGVMTGGAG